LKRWPFEAESAGQHGPGDVPILHSRTRDPGRRGKLGVTYGGNAGTIELVVETLTGDPEQDWLFETNGAGVMVAEPKVFGRVYLPDPQDEEDLLFVARAQ
jgi:hypothetical protein